MIVFFVLVFLYSLFLLLFLISISLPFCKALWITTVYEMCYIKFALPYQASQILTCEFLLNMQLYYRSLAWIVLVMVVEYSWSEWKPRRSDFKKICSSLTPLHYPLRSAHTLILSNCCCHDFQNNLAAGMGQILLLGSSFGPRPPVADSYFMEMLISFSSRTWHLPTLPKIPKAGSMIMV